MKIAVVVNPYIKNVEIKDNLLDSIKKDASFDVQILSDAKDIDSSFDRVLVFGGDGTILRSAKYAAQYEIPVIGVDLGRLGFLAEFAKSCSSEELISELKSDNIVNKMLISAKLNDESSIALNEIVIKSSQTKPIYLDLFVDGEYVDSYHSDGIIVSTPTGSTAYSLSAGGPVLSPSVDAMLIIPICPHSLHSRSLVVSSSSKIEIKVNRYIDALVSIDGEEFTKVNPGEVVEINKSNFSAKFIVKNKENFYKKLLDKMNKWGITE